jgi:hypothetical protein
LFSIPRHPLWHMVLCMANFCLNVLPYSSQCSILLHRCPYSYESCDLEFQLEQVCIKSKVQNHFMVSKFFNVILELLKEYNLKLLESSLKIWHIIKEKNLKKCKHWNIFHFILHGPNITWAHFLGFHSLISSTGYYTVFKSP